MLNRSKDLQFITEALNDLSTYEGVKIPSTSNRKTSHFLNQSTATSVNYQYPYSYQDFLARQQQMHRDGVKKAQELVGKFLPMEVSRLLQSNEAWDCPYSFQKPTNIKMIKNGPPPPEYCKLSVSLAASSDSEAIMNSITCSTAAEMEDLLLESEQPSVRSATDSDQHTSDTYSQDSDSGHEDDTTVESVPSNMKWYVKEDGSNVHISRALKVLLPREYISKERSRRHWVEKSLIQAWKEIDDSHDVIRFRDIAIKDKDRVEFLHILSIQSGDGKEQIRASSKTKGAVRGRPYVEVSDARYDVPYKTLVTKWIRLNKVLCEIEMLNSEDGTFQLSEQSKVTLQSKEKDMVLRIPHVSEDVDYYEVEKVLEVRINKDFHTEEYKVRFKGYGSEDDMWLPSSVFKEPVTFETVSKRGRLRRHTIKEGASGLDVQRSRTRKRKHTKDVYEGNFYIVVRSNLGPKK